MDIKFIQNLFKVILIIANANYYLLFYFNSQHKTKQQFSKS
jgi:hypothetical protein